jgi:hypothetical protein
MIKPNLILFSFLPSSQMKSSVSKIRFFMMPILICFLYLVFFLFQYSSQSKLGIGLYAHSFRFHSIIEYLIRYGLEAFYPRYEYLSISIALFSGILLSFYLYFRLYLRDFEIFYLVFLIFSPVVHPWYLLPWIAMQKNGIFFRYILFYSFSSVLSYTSYHPNYSKLSILIFSFEFFVLGRYLYERCSHHLRKKSHSR